MSALCVGDAMTKTVVTATIGETLETVAEKMRLSRVHSMPVVSVDGKLVGHITENDMVRSICAGQGISSPPALLELLRTDARLGRDRVLARLRIHLQTTLVDEAMTNEPEFVAPTASLEDATELMCRKNISRLAVLDHGTLVGVVSRVDMLAALTLGPSILAPHVILTAPA